VLKARDSFVPHYKNLFRDSSRFKKCHTVRMKSGQIANKLAVIFLCGLIIDLRCI
jgi:hypothetical protein